MTLSSKGHARNGGCLGLPQEGLACRPAVVQGLTRALAVAPLGLASRASGTAQQ
jgi:hypothetical protein